MGCRKVRYCYPACQKWDKQSHKPECGGREACHSFSYASDRGEGTPLTPE